MMWNVDIAFQLRAYFMFFALGIFTAIFYDFFRAIRVIKECSFFRIFLQDIIFWIIVTLFDFFASIAFLGGEIRLFAATAQIGGIVVFSCFFSGKTVYLFAIILSFLKRIKLFTSKILYKLCLKTNQLTEKTGNFIKKRLKKPKTEQKTLEKTQFGDV